MVFAIVNFPIIPELGYPLKRHGIRYIILGHLFDGILRMHINEHQSPDTHTLQLVDLATYQKHKAQQLGLQFPEEWAGAGVGVGMLRGMGIPSFEDKKVSTFQNFEVSNFQYLEISEFKSSKVSRCKVHVQRFQNFKMLNI